MAVDPNKLPQSRGKAKLYLEFETKNLITRDFGRFLVKAEFKAMLNGGYIVRIKLFDPDFNMLTTLVEDKYLADSRRQPFPIWFRLIWGDDDAGDIGVSSRYATKRQRAIVSSMRVHGEGADIGYVELVAIDPPSWSLNRGTASGKVYKGNVGEVIQRVLINEAPDIRPDVGRTTDSSENRFWTMRQDPRSFIASLTDWSSSVTPSKTNWLIAADGNLLTVKEQAAFQSERRALYTFWKPQDGSIDTIERYEMIADNALSLVQTKIITQGLSAISGQYLDPTTDPAEIKVVAKDSTTPRKFVPDTTDKQSFAKPTAPARNQRSSFGITSTHAIPEIYSAGELGRRYESYIDGTARGKWLGLNNRLLRCKFRVLGHGIWDSCRGLGVDTIHVTWIRAPIPGRERAEQQPQNRLWFLHGNWLVYGFHHVLVRGWWHTDVYAARLDYDAEGVRAGDNPVLVTS
jgi:hypothetical protein